MSAMPLPSFSYDFPAWKRIQKSSFFLYVKHIFRRTFFGVWKINPKRFSFKRKVHRDGWKIGKLLRNIKFLQKQFCDTYLSVTRKFKFHSTFDLITEERNWHVKWKFPKRCLEIQWKVYEFKENFKPKSKNRQFLIFIHWKTKVKYLSELNNNHHTRIIFGLRDQQTG
jgi:hypothetical protein